MKTRAMLLPLLLLATSPLAATAQNVGLPLGSKPAAIVLPDLDGNPVDMAQYIGKQPVLLEFWATWCPLCHAMQPQLEALHQKLGDKVQMLIVAVGVNENPRSIKRHLAKDPMPGRVLWDGDGVAVRNFEALATSYIVVLDKNGKVVYTGSGADQHLAPVLARL